MAHGKYLSLEEARNEGKLDQFAKEHPSTGDWGKFNQLFRAMSEGEPPDSLQKARAKSSQAKRQT